MDLQELDRRVALSVRHFWATRNNQSLRQSESGRSDQGSRGAVTGGKQMDAFVDLVREMIVSGGIPESSVHTSKNLEIPGYFRPEKKWDLLVVHEGSLIAAVEFKSHVGSFGNNFNNRCEEAIGNAQDIWTAYREGAFKLSQRPWLGFLMLMEDSPEANRTVKVREPHFEVFPEFESSSYSIRYQILLAKLLRERLYDAACFITSNANTGVDGEHGFPSSELSFARFAKALKSRVSACVAE